MNRVLKFLTSSLFIAFIVVTGICIVDQQRLDKYTAVLLDSDYLLYGQRVYFNDFDHDGISENVRLGYNNYSGLPFAMITDAKKGILAHWDFMEKWIDRSDMMFGDCDGNGFDEMYLLTQSGDSIFINGYEPHTKRSIVHKKLVDLAGRYEGMCDFDVFPLGVADVDCDGFKEVIFFINSGYSIYPRNLYIYSPVRDVISKSPVSGAQVPVSPVLADLDGDCYGEILARTYAPGNIADKSYPYRDSSSWLMVLDHRNRFLFDPVEFPGHTSAVRLVPWIRQDNSAIIVLAHSGSGGMRHSVALISFNLKGEKIDQLQFYFDERKRRFKDLFFRVKGDYTEPLILCADNRLFYIDEGFRLAGLTRLSENIRNYHPSHFIPQGYFLFKGPDQQSFLLYRDDFRHPYKFSVPNDGGHFTFSMVKRENERDAFSFQVGKHWYLFTTELNPYYFRRFAFYAALLLIIYFIVYLIKKVQRDQLAKRYRNEKEVLQLQMLALKNQSDPHFTLNVLNSIWSLSHDQQDKADRYFAKYANLIRQALSNGGKARVSLEEESAFVENYLTLERFRFGDRFDYTIDIEDGLKEIMIPRLLLHTFVENALKHGLRPLAEGGYLQISAKALKGRTEIRITDNGAGREQAARSSMQSTGQGLGIIDRMLDIYAQLYGLRITYEITDLKNNEGKPAGTTVVVRIPG